MAIAVVGAAVLFFFQAEDGIRDWSVTGVQTCALPISDEAPHQLGELLDARLAGEPCAQLRRERRTDQPARAPARVQPPERLAYTGDRSEERRVGKEGGTRWGAGH